MDEFETGGNEAGNGGEERGAANLAKRAKAREMLASRYGVDAAFMGVPKLARIIGLAPSTIYGYMRAGTFFMPHRVARGTPLVAVDDFVAWYCDEDGLGAAAASIRQAAKRH